MKRNVSLWQFAGFCLTTLAGTLLHFLYDWTNKNAFIAPFSGVNESTWEHMKLLYWPLLLFALIQSRFFTEYRHFWCIKLAGTAIGLVTIPVLFYTYNGAIGKSPDWLNIAFFFIAAAVTFLLETALFKCRSKSCRNSVAFPLLCAIGIAFLLFTFVTPHLPLFQDPLTGKYGI
jgi:hypothetical protein